MKAHLFLPALLLVLAPLRTLFSQSRTISGYVKDAQTGEALPGATVYDQRSKKGAAVNQYGFYSLTLRSDTLQLCIPTWATLRLGADQTVSVNLRPAALNEVVVPAPSASKESQITFYEFWQKCVKIFHNGLTFTG